MVTALCLPLYYYRDRIIRRFHGKADRAAKLDGEARCVPYTAGTVMGHAHEHASGRAVARSSTFTFAEVCPLALT